MGVWDGKLTLINLTAHNQVMISYTRDLLANCTFDNFISELKKEENFVENFKIITLFHKS